MDRTTLTDSAFNGSGLNPIDTGLVSPYGIAVDPDSGTVYWTSVTGNEIWRASKDGTSKAIVNIQPAPDLPRGIAIDDVHRRIFWVENGSKKIRSADLDGANAMDVVVSGLSAPTQIALDMEHDNVYWTDNGGSEKRIGVCGFDGSNPTIIDSTTSFVSGIAVDTTTGKIYWSEFGPAKCIIMANLNGSDTTVVDTLLSSDPRGVFAASQIGKIFWTDYLSNQIESASLDGSNKTILVTGLDNPLSVVVAGTTANTAVQRPAATPNAYNLYQNFPNPFNPSTVINYQLPMNSEVTLRVYDMLGRVVAILVNERENAGNYSATFDGGRLASGVYFYRLNAGSFSLTKKLVLMK